MCVLWHHFHHLYHLFYAFGDFQDPDTKRKFKRTFIYSDRHTEGTFSGKIPCQAMKQRLSNR